MLNLICSFASVMSTIGRVLLAFVILMFMVLIHEAGHYTAGKILKFKINEFAVGMGPKILSKQKKNGEVISLRLLPLGGFCAFEGEDEDAPSPQAFNNQKPWKRLIVLFSGVLMNFVSALIVCTVLFGAYGETVATVNRVYDYAPAINQQLESGDIIYKINGKKVFVLDDISRYMSDEMSVTVLKPNGEEVTYKGVTRNEYYTVSVKSLNGQKIEATFDGEVRALQEGDVIYKVDGKSISQEGDWKLFIDQASDSVTITVAADKLYDYTVAKSVLKNWLDVNKTSYKGIGMSVGYKTHKFGFGEALLRVVPYCGEVGLLVLRTLGGLLTGVVGLDKVGGPISTIATASQVVSYGFASVLSLFVLISVNLAVFNLLPVPALDGCQMIFVIIEWIAGKPINRKVQSWINFVGLILLLGFAVLVDLLKL